MTAPPNPRPKQIETRFLYPFFFHRDKAGEASALLEKAKLDHPGRKAIDLWECCAPPVLYSEELLDHVEKFLFHGTGRGCRYLRVPSAATSRLFNKLEAILSEPKPSPANDGMAASTNIAAQAPIIWPVGLVPKTGIEVFLTNYGVGLLSISLTPEDVELDFETVTLFNYKLAQLRSQVSARLHIPHSSENQQVWAQLSAAHKQKIPPMPSIDAPLNDRIQTAGGTFLLGELVADVLLKPLSGLGVKPFQNQFSVYSVIRFGDEVDFEKEETTKSLAAFLSAISQIEEPTHAGAPAGVVGLTNAVLNRRHFAAVGLLGMAHIVSDQPGPSAFNEQRVPRVMTKYFVPYLAGLLQRVALQRSIHEASDFVLNKREETPAGLAKLRTHMLEFAVEGYFPEISHREVLDRYYRMVREGLGVRRAYDDVNRSIAEIDAQFSAKHQVELAETMARNAEATMKMQHHVSLLERFIVSVYAAELWHLATGEIESLRHWMPYGVVGFAMLGFVCAWAFGRRAENPRTARAVTNTSLLFTS